MAASIPTYQILTTVEALRKLIKENFSKQINEGQDYDSRDIQRFNEVDEYTSMFIQHGQHGKTFDENAALRHFHDAMVWRKQNNVYAVKCFITYNFEEQIRAHPGQRIVIILDMTGTGLRHLDYLRHYYPGLLSYMLVYKLPFILQEVWKIIKSWVPTEARNTVIPVDEKTILQYISRDQILGKLRCFARDKP